jgi:hypothetical protein
MERVALTVFFVDQIVPESALERVIYSRYDALSVTGDGSGASRSSAWTRERTEQVNPRQPIGELRQPVTANPSALSLGALWSRPNAPTLARPSKRND